MARQRRRTKQIRQIAQTTFGYDELRPGQEAAIQSVLEGHDTLVVMPTGSGKSAIYQIAAVQLAGPTVVVSPLIALQKDQVESIEQQDIGGAMQVNSTMGTGDRQEAFENLQSGDLEFIFLAPEQFNNPETLEQLRAAKPSLFVVDEAHCISEWGHDFRPDYLRLATVIEALDHPITLALTATAAPPVREEIVDRLGMEDAHVIVQGFDRPNIWLGVRRFETEAEKQAALIQRALKITKPGIIYTATRKHAEEISKILSEHHVKALFYHAGMKRKEREDAQNAFMNDEIDVIVATTAFGMGVDKPNVRFVYHYDISDSIDSYYQEIGRAGRDGKPAKALLFYQPGDLNLRRFLAATGQIDAAQVAQVAIALEEADKPIRLKDVQHATDLSQSKVTTALNRLETAGVVEMLPTGEVVAAGAIDLGTVLEEANQVEEQHQQRGRSRLEMMQGYAESRDCRREYLLNYFGEKLNHPCGFCDNCKARNRIDTQAKSEDASTKSNPSEANKPLPYPLDSHVIHKSWGEGVVIRYEEEKIVVLFDQVGYKTIDIDVARLYGLLRRIQ